LVRLSLESKQEGQPAGELAALETGPLGGGHGRSNTMDRYYEDTGSGASHLTREDIISALRTACAWFEWGEPSDLKAAGALQDAADAVRDGKMGLDAARSLLDDYRTRAVPGGVR
jgi:hypothetical protein